MYYPHLLTREYIALWHAFTLACTLPHKIKGSPNVHEFVEVRALPGFYAKQFTIVANDPGVDATLKFNEKKNLQSTNTPVNKILESWQNFENTFSNTLALKSTRRRGGPDRFAPRRTQTWVDVVVATGFHPWLHTLFPVHDISSRLVPTVLRPPFDLAHDR